MICLSKNEQGAELLAGYLAKTLDAARMAELDRHIRECSDCRGLATVWERLDEFAVPEVTPGFDARLYARIAREEARRHPGGGAVGCGVRLLRWLRLPRWWRWCCSCMFPEGQDAAKQASQAGRSNKWRRPWTI